MRSDGDDRYLAMEEAYDDRDCQAAINKLIDACWNLIFQTVSSVGKYRSVNFEDKLVNVTIRRMGGWPHLCGTLRPVDFTGRLRNQFRRLYHEALRHGFQDGKQKHLPGLHELENKGRGVASTTHIVSV